MKKIIIYSARLIKYIFWFFFANIAFLLALICSQIYENFEKYSDNVKYIFFSYIILLILYICSFFTHIKKAKYILALSIIGLFLYGSIKEDTAEYFNFLPLND